MFYHFKYNNLPVQSWRVTLISLDFCSFLRILLSFRFWTMLSQKETSVGLKSLIRVMLDSNSHIDWTKRHVLHFWILKNVDCYVFIFSANLRINAIKTKLTLLYRHELLYWSTRPTHTRPVVVITVFTRVRPSVSTFQNQIK